MQFLSAASNGLNLYIDRSAQTNAELTPAVSWAYPFSLKLSYLAENIEGRLSHPFWISNCSNVGRWIVDITHDAQA